MGIHTGDDTGDIIASYDTPDDGDDVTAASVNVALHGLTDDVAKVRARLRKVQLMSDLGAHVRSIDAYPVVGGTVYTHADYQGGAISLPSSPGTIRWPLDLPNGAELSEVFIRVDPAVLIGDLPGPPSGRIRARIRYTSLAGVETTTAAIRDLVASATYVDAHEATFGDFALVIDRTTYSYELEIEGEDGAAADQVLVLSPPFVSYTVPPET